MAISNKKLYKDSVVVFGHEVSINMAVKEASKLINEIQNHKLMKECNIQQAIANMEIACHQLKVIFPGVNKVKQEGLLRLQEKINNRIR